MTREKINQESQVLAKVVICSLKNQRSVKSWVETNLDYRPEGDRVVIKAVEIIRKTLTDKRFNLKSYKKLSKKG